jgi:2-iminobutanoate/2-iminopropanoate deaminase
MVADHQSGEHQGRMSVSTLMQNCHVFRRPPAVNCQPLEFIVPRKPFRSELPLSPAVRVGKLVFVSGTPPFAPDGSIARDCFSNQMQQVMENVALVLKTIGTGWDRVAKATVLLTREQDFAEMNRIYSSFFPSGQYPARTVAYVAALPHRDFLVEIECQAVLD